MDHRTEDGMPAASISSERDARGELLNRAITLEGFTVGWNVIEGIIAVAAGAAAASVALTGFGIDSFIETTSGAVVGWRLWLEKRAAKGVHAEAIERRASKIAGALLLALAVYVLIDAARRLAGFGAQADESPLGMILTCVSLAVMPFLGWAKLKTARALGSAALRADAYETITCAWLSLTTLGGLALNSAFGWWWADPAAALVLVPLIAREGLEGWRGGCGCHEDHATASEINH